MAERAVEQYLLVFGRHRIAPAYGQVHGRQLSPVAFEELAKLA
jgi:hypothetical protein